METKPAFSAAVLEVLKQDNYLDWSVRVKTYLMAQDLWDVVESRSEPPAQENATVFKAWSKTNAMALHVIQMLCGPELLGIPWQRSTKLNVLTQVAGNLDHSNIQYR